MSISKYNAEGYYSPTEYEGLTNVMREEKAKRFRPLVYICSPYAGDIETNTANAKKYCLFAVHQHSIPLAPHLLYPQFMDETSEADRNLGLFFGIVLLDRCHELWVFGDTVSAGMKAEINRAKRKNQPIRYFTANCEEVKPNENSSR